MVTRGNGLRSRYARKLFWVRVKLGREAGERKSLAQTGLGFVGEYADWSAPGGVT